MKEAREGDLDHFHVIGVLEVMKGCGRGLYTSLEVACEGRGGNLSWLGRVDVLIPAYSPIS